MDLQARVRQRYNPDWHHVKAQEFLDKVSREECEAWYNHPCTKSLLMSLEGDLSGIVLLWLSGAYSSEEHADSTAQQQAKARGMAQAISDMLEHIESVKERKLEGDIVDESTYPS